MAKRKYFYRIVGQLQLPKKGRIFDLISLMIIRKEILKESTVCQISYIWINTVLNFLLYTFLAMAFSQDNNIKHVQVDDFLFRYYPAFATVMIV